MHAKYTRAFCVNMVKIQGRKILKVVVCNDMELEHLRNIKAQTDDDAISFYRKCGFAEEEKFEWHKIL